MERRNERARQRNEVCGGDGNSALTAVIVSNISYKELTFGRQHTAVTLVVLRVNYSLKCLLGRG